MSDLISREAALAILAPAANSRGGLWARRRRGTAMTPARKAALQWFHDRGEVRLTQDGRFSEEPTSNMVGRMMTEGLLERRAISPWDGLYSLTDKGRRALHGDAT